MRCEGYLEKAPLGRQIHKGDARTCALLTSIGRSWVDKYESYENAPTNILTRLFTNILHSKCRANLRKWCRRGSNGLCLEKDKVVKISDTWSSAMCDENARYTVRSEPGATWTIAEYSA